MENKDLEIFDEKVDRYLRSQMTAQEETEFKELLASDEELRSRAKTTALMIRQMEIVGKKKDEIIINTIKGMSEEEFLKVVNASMHGKDNKENNDTNEIQHESAQQVRKPTHTHTHKAKPIIPIWPKVIKYVAAACVIGILFLGGYSYGHNYYLSQMSMELGRKSLKNFSLYNQVDQIEIDDNTAVGGENRGGEEDVIIPKIRRAILRTIEYPDREHRKYLISELESLYEDSLDPNSDYANYKDDIAWHLAIVYLIDGNRKKPIPVLQGIIDRNKAYPDLIQPVQELMGQIKAL